MTNFLQSVTEHSNLRIVEKATDKCKAIFKKILTK